LNTGLQKLQSLPPATKVGPFQSPTGDDRWDEKAGLQRDALSSQVIDALEAQEIEETGDEEAYHHDRAGDTQQSDRLCLLQVAV
jgi:hypothetical protein